MPVFQTCLEFRRALIVTLVFAGLIVGRCDADALGQQAGSKSSAAAVEASAPRTVLRVPADHVLSDDGELVAIDVQHGSGGAKLELRRIWRGDETADTGFGPGWSDANLVRLTMPDERRVMIWCGGVGWCIGEPQKDGDFATAEGDTIRKASSGWTMEQPSGARLDFDSDGRLLSVKPAAGPKRTYTYDEQGRLLTLGTSPENTLRYHYDGERINRIDGPEGLLAEYRYDPSGPLIEAINFRKVKISYRYGGNRELASASDPFGSEFDPPSKAHAASKESADSKPAAAAEPVSPGRKSAAAGSSAEVRRSWPGDRESVERLDHVVRLQRSRRRRLDPHA